jgi:pimeloyl-ACP methyl ester carboxylesterase
MLGYMARRPSLYELTDEMAHIDAPLLVITGDEDDPTLDPSVLIKRTVASAALAVLPKTGHLMNLEEPALFNHLLENFFHQVEAGRWTARA